ncbi:MAG: repressor LexA [Caldilineales bacterium]|nr:repressor LexA [Caldilineales bacterium]
MMYTPLRPRQEEILRFIESYLDENNYPPTIREIGQAVGISSTSVVNYNLEKLEELKLIERNREVSRGLRLVGRDGIGWREVPLYGAIAAGDPIPLPEDPAALDEQVLAPEEMLPSSGEVFALRIKGQSMIDALLDDGDVIIVRSQPEVETGEVAVIEVLEPPEWAGATVKRFYFAEDQVELRPANPTYTSLWLLPDQVRIYGKVVSALRQYR